MDRWMLDDYFGLVCRECGKPPLNCKCNVPCIDEESDLEWAQERRKEIMKIARMAAVKRGYAIYADFSEYMFQLMNQAELKSTGGGWFQQTDFQPTLEKAGWKRDTAYRPTRFYPPEDEATP